MKAMILMSLVAMSAISRAELPPDPLTVDEAGNCTLFAEARIQQIESDSKHALEVAHAIAYVSSVLNGAGNVKVQARYDAEVKADIYQCLINSIQFRDVKCKRTYDQKDFNGADLKGACEILKSNLNDLKNGIL